MDTDKLIRDMVVKLSKDIYQDSLQPSARTLGTELDQVISALKIATLPFAVMGKSADYLLERYGNFLSESIRKVEAQNRVPSQPSISVPVLQNVQRSFEQKEIYEMYSNLLASASDKTKTNLVHPSFPDIIAQLDSLDAVILDKGKSDFLSYYFLVFRNERGIMLNLSEPFCFIDGYEDSYTQITSSLVNLQRLGLIYKLPNLSSDPPIKIKKIKNDLVDLLIKFRVFNKQTADDLLAKGLVSMDSGFFKPTSLGRKFLLTCTKPAA